MAHYYNIVIPSSLSDVFEMFVKFNKNREYERFTWLSPLFTRYRMKHADLLGAVQEIHMNYQIGCTYEDRESLLYAISRDILDPPAIYKSK